MHLLQARAERKTVYSCVGLDVGATSLRCAQLKRVRGGWRIHLLASWLAPTGIPDFRHHESARARAFQWLTELEFTRRQAIAGLSPPDLEHHAMELPPIPAAGAEALQQAAHWEIERLMTYEEGTAQTAFWSLPGGRALRATAIGVAAPRANLDQVLEICRAGRLDCMQVDAASCALARFATLLREPEAAQEVWGVLDLGLRLTRLVIVVDDTPVLVRAFEMCGERWTQHLAGTLQVTTTTAERHKRDHGLQPPRRGGGGPPLAEMIFNALRADLDGLVAEIERSFRYVLGSFPKRPPGVLLLVGGGASMRNLPELLTQRLGIPVRAPQFDGSVPLLEKTSGCTAREPLSAFAGAIGLAYAGGGT
jgi:Tfp pilus assembly PilM family ATPase